MCIARLTYDLFFFFNTPATPEIYTLSLHDALPISVAGLEPDTAAKSAQANTPAMARPPWKWPTRDRKSTRLNSSHRTISYAVFCLKKKKIQRLYQQHHDINVASHPT